MRFRIRSQWVPGAIALSLHLVAFTAELPPNFESVQPLDFNLPEGQAIAWSDIEGDGDLDLAIGFRSKSLALFRNDNGHFVDIAREAGIETGTIDTRSLSWADIDGDGRPDLFVGFGRGSGDGNRLYRNESTGFVDVAASNGLAMPNVAAGSMRQASWIDVDGDGDSDLYVAVRWGSNRLFRNDDGQFVDISAESGLADPRRTVGAAWLDMDEDGDLDLFVANQSGDRDGVYRNDQGRFVDIAAALNMDRPGRRLVDGSVGVSVCDFNNDGHFDIYVPSYGDDILYLGNGDGGYRDVSRAWGVDASEKSVASDCGDYDNDGHVDLYVAAYAVGELYGYDHLYRNIGGRFDDVLVENHRMPDADHGVRWADFDADGDLDIAMTNRNAGAALLRNTLGTSDTSRSLSLTLTDEEGVHGFQGAEIRVFEPGTERVLASRLVDTGGGYVSQNLAPVHIGLGSTRRVDIVVTWPDGRSRRTWRFDDIDVPATSRKSIVLELGDSPAAAGDNVAN